MTRLAFIDLTLASLLFVFTCSSAPPAESSRPLGVFAGTSPCEAVSRRPLRIPATADCEMIKWKLTLYQDPAGLAPTTYELNFTYGMSQPNTNGLMNGGTKVERKGKWTTTQSTKTNTAGVTFTLDPERSEESMSFLKVDDNLLHLLDMNSGLAVGNGGWSYTLSRTEPVRPAVPGNSAAVPSPQLTKLTNSPASRASVSSILARFQGRSPCIEVARELNKNVEVDCKKAKWDLTLYQDSKTLAPTTYKLRGTFYRDQEKEGTWTILRGVKVNPAAVVYRLDPDASQGSLILLKADENILFFADHSRNLLVGNNDFSYTLNRVR